MLKIKTIDPKKLEKFLTYRKDEYELIDIRSVSDYNASHISVAISLPIDSVCFMDYVSLKKLVFSIVSLQCVQLKIEKN